MTHKKSTAYFILFLLFGNFSYCHPYLGAEITSLSFNAPLASSAGSGKSMQIDDMEFALFGSSDSPAFNLNHDLLSNTTAADVVLKITDTPLNYPNPFRFANGTQLQYTLNKDADVDFILYNLAARQVAKNTFRSGFQGGSSGINHPTITTRILGNLPAGLYYYLLVSEGAVLGKGKMVIIP